jgi:glycosyltransferase involved in cell wall biosynthesis
MKLLIISAMPHYTRDGVVVGWGPTVNELDHLATLFDEIRHVCAMHSSPAPMTALPYVARNITMIPLPATGGATLRDKLSILSRTPRYLLTILCELRKADIVHVRCPANVSLLAILLLSLRLKPSRRWVKYAGNWQPKGYEPWSYRFQRWWLDMNLHRGLVTVNGSWPRQPAHVRPFLNPCLGATELEDGCVAHARKCLKETCRIVFAGRLETEKGAGRVIDIVARLRSRGLSVHADLVGDGAERPLFEARVRELGLSSTITFHGWLPRPALNPLYKAAHFMLLPSTCSEGWPKVLSEAMAFGVVPIASTVSSIPQLLAEFRTGRAIPAGDIDKYADAIQAFATNPEMWLDHSLKAVQAARRFSYTHYLEAVSKLLAMDASCTETDLSHIALDR